MSVNASDSQIRKSRRTRLTLVAFYAIGVAIACTSRQFGEEENKHATTETVKTTATAHGTATASPTQDDGPIIDERLYEYNRPATPAK